MRCALALLAAASLLTACAADDASTVEVDPTGVSTAGPVTDAPATAPSDAPADGSAEAFWADFTSAIATGAPGAEIPFLQFPLSVAGETMDEAAYRASFVAESWTDPGFMTAIRNLSVGDMESEGDGYRFNALSTTVVEGEGYESSLLGTIARTPAGAWKITRVDMAG